MEQRDQLYEGKAKRVFATADPNLVIFAYKDDATAFNGVKHEQFPGKGELNNKLSSLLLTAVAAAGVPTHFVRRLDERRQLCRRVEIVPLEVVVRNRVAGSMAKRLGMEEGTELRHPVVELCYKDDALGDPLVAPSHAAATGMARWAEIRWMERSAITVNRILRDHFAAVGIELIDFKLEFGRLPAEATVPAAETRAGESSGTEGIVLGPGRLILADEISPDTCRLWDRATGERLDKDRFRRDLAPLLDGYREILRRLESASPEAVATGSIAGVTV
jgi:phosphoribosylaminoimidazole-succinocarboxamide synthase